MKAQVSDARSCERAGPYAGWLLLLGVPLYLPVGFFFPPFSAAFVISPPVLFPDSSLILSSCPDQFFVVFPFPPPPPHCVAFLQRRPALFTDPGIKVAFRSPLFSKVSSIRNLSSHVFLDNRLCLLSSAKIFPERESLRTDTRHSLSLRCPYYQQVSFVPDSRAPHDFFPRRDRS